MFRFILLLIIFLGLGIASSMFLGGDKSHFIASYGRWQLENSLPVLFLLILLSYILFWTAWKIISGLWSLPNNFDAYSQRRKKEKSAEQLNKGLIQLLECDYAKAEKSLTKFVDLSDAPLVNYLGAARAAAQLDNDTARDRYLEAALATSPKADIAVMLTKAELQLNHNQNEEALATLTELRKKAPQNPTVLKLLSRLHIQLKDWKKLSNVLPDLRKSNVMSEQQLDSLSLETYQGLLDDASQANLDSSVKEAWGSLPKMMKKDSRLISVYVTNLIRSGEHEQAEKMIREHLDKNWDENLIKLYGKLSIKDNGKLLHNCVRWENAKPQSPNLMLSLARLNHRLKHWDKAETYYRASIKLSPSVEAYTEYNDLLEELGRGDSEEALRIRADKAEHTLTT